MVRHRIFRRSARASRTARAGPRAPHWSTRGTPGMAHEQEIAWRAGSVRFDRRPDMLLNAARTSLEEIIVVQRSIHGS